jgi:DNA-binding transcriptional ArsR family regulator
MVFGHEPGLVAVSVERGFERRASRGTAGCEGAGLRRRGPLPDVRRRPDPRVAAGQAAAPGRHHLPGLRAQHQDPHHPDARPDPDPTPALPAGLEALYESLLHPIGERGLAPKSVYLALRSGPCVQVRIVITYNHMVVGLLKAERADRVFHALADVTRRDIVVRTLEGEHSVSALARRYPMSFAAVQKHVAVLEEAGLVTKQRKGREQLVRGNVDTVRRASQLLDALDAVWRGRVDRMSEILADPNGGTQ